MSLFNISLSNINRLHVCFCYSLILLSSKIPLMQYDNCKVHGSNPEFTTHFKYILILYVFISKSKMLFEIPNRCIVIFYIISTSGCSIIFSFQTIILLLWVIVLFKESNRLRKKAKYSTLSLYNEDASLQALNSKVEYRKSLFLFAIVLSELVSSILTLVVSTQALFFLIQVITYPTTHHNLAQNLTHVVIHSNNAISNPGCNFSRHIDTSWGEANTDISRNKYSSFSFPLIITFSLVYTLMSYYVMVTKKSLNYNTSLKSVDLAREQKILLFSSFISCTVLFLLLVRIQLYLLCSLVECCILITQVILTLYYRRKLIQVIRWKILDTKIAFGTNNYLYRYYNRSLRYFRSFTCVYTILIASFCSFVIVRFFQYLLLLLLQPYELYTLYRVCVYIPRSPQFVSTLDTLITYITLLDKIPLIISLLSLFMLNMMTIPYLLSKLHWSCHLSCRFCTFRASRHLRYPLLS